VAKRRHRIIITNTENERERERRDKCTHNPLVERPSRAVNTAREQLTGKKVCVHFEKKKEREREGKKYFVEPT
jgi:hypothetical protein